MKNWDIADETGTCRADKDADDAEYICKHLQIPFHYSDFVKGRDIFKIYSIYLCINSRDFWLSWSIWAAMYSIGSVHNTKDFQKKLFDELKKIIPYFFQNIGMKFLRLY